MAFVPSSRERVFPFGEHLGIIKNGIFTPVEFEEERFKNVILEMLDCTENSIKADVVLQKAMKRYCNIPVIEKLYKGKSKFDSGFYLKWKNYILNLDKFKQENPKAKESYNQKKRIVEKARLTNNIIHSWQVESIIQMR